MDDIERRIMEFAIREYPGQPEEGFAYFKMQVDAYRACEAFCPPDIPPATLRGIKRRAASMDGDDCLFAQQEREAHPQTAQLTKVIKNT